jgi:hypothetical protein
MTHRKSVVFYLYSNKAKIKECMLKSYILFIRFMAEDYDDIVGVVDLKIFSRILMMKISIVGDHDGAPFIMEHTAAKPWKGLRKQVSIMPCVQMNMVFSRSHNVE